MRRRVRVLGTTSIPGSILDAGNLAIHGKGKKDRTVPLPGAIIPEL
ncbi:MULTISPECIES: hypothetical protein [Geobacter]|nr:hypothetical protein [Geobacter sulfurreducens]BEH09582.1 hypothetical protein GSUET_11940 [Geobacter sulfurreducens subsp. ethanolicus]BET57463.1 hypothetical protein GEO60473_05030 [Geobacter sp. 60473]